MKIKDYQLRWRTQKGDELLLASDSLAIIYRHKSIYDRIWKDEGEHGIIYKPYIVKEEWVK